MPGYFDTGRDTLATCEKYWQTLDDDQFACDCSLAATWFLMALCRIGWGSMPDWDFLLSRIAGVVSREGEPPIHNLPDEVRGILHLERFQYVDRKPRRWSAGIVRLPQDPWGLKVLKSIGWDRGVEKKRDFGSEMRFRRETLEALRRLEGYVKHVIEKR